MRLHPKELHGLAGCRKDDLEHLEPDDAVEFMRRQRVKGPRSDIVHACEPYDFLPLCVSLLSRAVREASKRPGGMGATQSANPVAQGSRRRDGQAASPFR